MSVKRRDNKNRFLRTGESQEADGRYKFRYIDANGKRKSVYSWRLVVTDSIPQTWLFYHNNLKKFSGQITFIWLSMYFSNCSRLISALLPFQRTKSSSGCCWTKSFSFLYPIPKYSDASFSVNVYFCHQGNSFFISVLISGTSLLFS